MPDCTTDLPRRGLLRALVLAAAAGLAAAEPLCAQPKMSKQDAEYQDAPKDIRMCTTCTLFEAPAEEEGDRCSGDQTNFPSVHPILQRVTLSPAPSDLNLRPLGGGPRRSVGHMLANKAAGQKPERDFFLSSGSVLRTQAGECTR